MCGRYTLNLPIVELADQLDLDLPEFTFEPRYNIAPTQKLPIVTFEEGKVLALHRWGLIPFWAKDPSIGNKMINARGETLAHKPAFRTALARRRCLVPASGFYEWKKTPTGKIPQHIHNQDQSLLTFAGLWESWKDGEDKELRSFTIITVTPNELMAPIHDRMPAIILPQDRERWLSPDLTSEEALQLLRPCPDGLLTADPVSTLVNSPRNEGPELLAPPNTLF